MPPIIADRRGALPRVLALLTMAAGAAAWITFLQQGVVLSHYDAKAHLVVARRILDSITPSWQQVGAVWLPLPHLLNALPVQVDALYRTGASGSLISIASFGVCAWAAARLVLALTGSGWGAATSVAVLGLNPNLLYLQATPMTEPLLLGLSALTVLWIYEWVEEISPKAQSPKPRAESQQPVVPRKLGWLLVALTLTRYEAWPIIGAAIAAAAYVLWRRGLPLQEALGRAGRLAVWVAVAVVGFLINSRITVGAWFVSGGFYVPDPTYQGQAIRTAIALWWGTHSLSGYVVTTIAVASAVVLAIRAGARRADAALLFPVALLAAAALPFVAFYQGHPFRIRYMVPLVAGAAVLNGIAAGWARRAAPFAAAVIVASLLVESPPWSPAAPMLLEAQWDRPASAGRRAVTACLAPAYRGEKVLASMGSLAHYMQELSASGFDIADFIHEGNGHIWHAALASGPAPHAGWMLVEEQAEGGDLLAQKLRDNPAFAAGMERICEGGGVALYRRASRAGAASR